MAKVNKLPAAKEVKEEWKKGGIRMVSGQRNERRNQSDKTWIIDPAFKIDGAALGNLLKVADFEKWSSFK